MSISAAYETFDAVGLAELVARGEVTPDELLDEALKRVEALNPTLNAVTMLREDVARRLIAEGLPEGPLRGVPFLLKDLGAEAIDFPSNNGSRLFAGTTYATGFGDLRQAEGRRPRDLRAHHRRPKAASGRSPKRPSMAGRPAIPGTSSARRAARRAARRLPSPPASCPPRTARMAAAPSASRPPPAASSASSRPAPACPTAPMPAKAGPAWRSTAS